MLAAMLLARWDMSPHNSIASVALGALKKVWEGFTGNSATKEKNLEINAEIERQSGGALTPRKLLMYVLVLAAIWELIARPVIVTYWPQAKLPDPMIDTLLPALAALFGF